MADSIAVAPVDEILPPGKLAALGLQHVLVMYAGAVAVPLIVGAALKLPKEQIALLITPICSAAASSRSSSRLASVLSASDCR